MHSVYFALDDLEVEVSPGTSLVDIVEQTGADVTFGCKNGTCGTCRIHVTKGASHLSEMGADEKDFLQILGAHENDRLACQVCVNGDCIIDYKGL